MTKTTAETLLPFKFGGVKLYYTSYGLEGRFSHQEHKYPKSAGATVPEKDQREAYRISVQMKFDQARYDDPVETLQKLRAVFESGETKLLEIPHVGKFEAFCENWSEQVSAAYRSGFDVKLSFVEDEKAPADLIVPTKLAGIGGAMSKLKESAKGATDKNLWSLLDKLDAAVTQVVTLRDTAEMNVLLLEAKLQSAVNLVGELDRTVDFMKDPGNHLVLDALMDLWKALADLAGNLTGKSSDMKSWTVPRDMTAADVSRKLYGDATHEPDILALNLIEDPALIRAGRRIRYYPA